MSFVKNIIEKPVNEYKFFLTMPHPMRVLLVTNMIYAFVLPVIDVFIAAYIMRNTNNDFVLVAIYQLTVYTGIPFTFLINGYLLRKIKISHLYSFGMLLSGASMIFMMSLGELNTAGVAIAGLIMGSSFGFFWANRDFLALNTTNDNNRNYYYGVETFFYTLTGIVVPVFIGWFIIHAQSIDWVGSNINRAYQIITFMVFVLTICSSIMIHRGKFQNPKQNKFVFFNFDKLWYKMLSLASLKGIAQGFIVTAPAILIMKLVGNEDALGLTKSLCGVFTAIVLYLLGRFTKPKHRIAIFTVGVIIFLIGSLVNGILFSAAGVFTFMICLVLFQPLHDIAYFPIQMRVIDVLSKKEKKSEYAYIFNHEFGLYVGRFFGLGLFILLATYVSKEFALKYALIIIAALQLIAIPVAKHIIKEADKMAGKDK
jgi:YQGE family putative transporter